MSQFKTITYSDLLFEFLRYDLSINKVTNSLSILYRWFYAIIFPLQSSFDNYDTFRKKYWHIGGCKPTCGQLANLLNYYFDPTDKRIEIQQATYNFTFVPTIDDGESTVMAYNIDETNTDVQIANIDDQRITKNIAEIKVPTALLTDELKKVVNLILIEGLNVENIHYKYTLI